MTTYDVGDVVELATTVTVDGVLTNATVVLTVYAPSGSTSTPTVTNGSTGAYSATFSPSQVGEHRYRWVASGAATATEWGRFAVEPTPTTAAVPLADLKSHLNVTTSTHDVEMARTLNAVIKEIERKGIPLTAVAKTETFDGGGTTYVPEYADIIAVTSAEYGDGTAIDEADLVVSNGLIRWGYGTAGAFTSGTYNVTITYTAGFATLPDDLRMAVLDVAAFKWKRSQRSSGSARPNFPGEGPDDVADGTPYPADAWAVIQSYSPHIGIG